MTWENIQRVNPVLIEHHYLGPIRRGIAWQDEYGVIVAAKPTARHIPREWLELSRWCIVDRTKNAGSRQWAGFVRALRDLCPDVTTIVSYSNPSVGHTGALYRACNWWWAPTWHRLRPPPTGNGAWTEGAYESVKDRWIFSLQPDAGRVFVLLAQDEAVLEQMPFARYREPGGADYKAFLARRAIA